MQFDAASRCIIASWPFSKCVLFCLTHIVKLEGRSSIKRKQQFDMHTPDATQYNNGHVVIGHFRVAGVRRERRKRSSPLRPSQRWKIHPFVVNTNRAIKIQSVQGCGNDDARIHEAHSAGHVQIIFATACTINLWCPREKKRKEKQSFCFSRGSCNVYVDANKFRWEARGVFRKIRNVSWRSERDAWWKS